MAAHSSVNYSTPPHFRRQVLPSPPASSTLHKVSPMAVDTLLTPPPSQSMPLYHDFESAQRETEDYQQDVLFPQQSQQASPLHLFASTAATFSPIRDKRTTSGAYSITAPEQYVNRSQTRHTPIWNASETAAEKFARGNGHTWQDVSRNDIDSRTHYNKPTDEEYELVASFFHDMQTWRGSVEATPSRTTKSKVTKPSAPHRRNGSSTHPGTQHPTKAPAATPIRASRMGVTRPSVKSSVGETKSARAPSSKPAKDPEWRNYYDYAPKEQYMNLARAYAAINETKNFAEHKSRFDLTDDPDKAYLNEAELAMCGRLALDCHRFLTSKRQIFEGYVKHLRTKFDIEERIRAGVEDRGFTRLPSWNKTAAQSLMGIDVTKGSHIWSFYNEVGFFDEKLFTHQIMKPTVQA